MEGERVRQTETLTHVLVCSCVRVMNLLHVALLEQIICREVVSVWYPAQTCVCAMVWER